MTLFTSLYALHGVLRRPAYYSWLFLSPVANILLPFDSESLFLCRAVGISGHILTLPAMKHRRLVAMTGFVMETCIIQEEDVRYVSFVSGRAANSRSSP